MEADWANLGEPLSLILNKLVELADHIRFTAVCKNWCSIAKLYRGNCQFRNIMPMLLIPTQEIEKKILYEISSKRVYHCQLPVSYDKRCCGSSHGWLATVDRCYVITLTNPFKNAVAAIRLPPISIVDTWWRELHEYNIHKVILSANPATNPCDYVVVAIYGVLRHLAFIKAGQKFWTYVDNHYYWFNDVTFYKGLVYAVGEFNKIVSFDLSYSKDPYGSEKKIIPKVVSDAAYDDCVERPHLVKSLEGDLWLVKRFMDCNDFDSKKSIKSFEVYSTELDDRSGKFLQKLKLDSLGDNILFVGDSDSISVSASNCSKYLQRDSIYYIHNFFGYKAISSPSRSFCTGIYNIKDGNFSKHYSYEPSFKEMSSPIWVLPPFQWD